MQPPPGQGESGAAVNCLARVGGRKEEMEGGKERKQWSRREGASERGGRHRGNGGGGQRGGRKRER